MTKINLPEGLEARIRLGDPTIVLVTELGGLTRIFAEADESSIETVLLLSSGFVTSEMDIKIAARRMSPALDSNALAHHFGSEAIGKLLWVQPRCVRWLEP